MSRDHIHPHRHKQLFLDDGAIETMSGLQRVLHRPERCGPVLRPDRSRGELLTAAFIWKGERLYVNADADDGEVLVEVVDAKSRTPLPGCSARECQALRGDHLRGAMTWGGRTETEFTETPVRLRFHLRRARLYAFWLE